MEFYASPAAFWHFDPNGTCFVGHVRGLRWDSWDGVGSGRVAVELRCTRYFVACEYLAAESLFGAVKDPILQTKFALWRVNPITPPQRTRGPSI